jgi:hypothetical protein
MRVSDPIGQNIIRELIQDIYLKSDIIAKAREPKIGKMRRYDKMPGSYAFFLLPFLAPSPPVKES